MECEKSQAGGVGEEEGDGGGQRVVLECSAQARNIVSTGRHGVRTHNTRRSGKRWKVFGMPPEKRLVCSSLREKNVTQKNRNGKTSAGSGTSHSPTPRRFPSAGVSTDHS